MVFNSVKFPNLSSTQTEKLIAEFCIKCTFILYWCNNAKISLMFSSMMNEKSIDESEISNWFFLTMKHGKDGSRSFPFETEVPGKVGFKNDFTKSGISFLCNGCKVFG